MILLKIVTPPSGSVISLQDAKAQSRIDHNDEDVLIESYIAVATDKAEQLTGRKLLTQTWDWLLDEFPAGDLLIPLSPLVTIDSIQYYDTANALQTWSSANYQVDAAGMRPRVCPVLNVQWPDTYDRIGAVQVRMTVGYGAATAIPQAIKHWITAAVGEAFKNRELTSDRQRPGETLSSFINGLLDPYTVPAIK